MRFVLDSSLVEIDKTVIGFRSIDLFGHILPHINLNLVDLYGDLIQLPQSTLSKELHPTEMFVNIYIREH